MIDSRELRLGNWVAPVLEIHGGDMDFEYLPPCQVSELPIQEAYKFYKPIPITPEILEKCGFEMPPQSKWINDDWIMYQNPDGKFYLQIEKQGSEEYICERIEIPIKHLHQLQNLYFCLTGTELTISL